MAVTAIVLGGAAVGAYFLLFADNSQALAAVARQGEAMLAESSAKAEVVAAAHRRDSRIAGLDARVKELEGQLTEAHDAIKKLDSEKAAALEKAAEEARLRAEAEAAKATNGGHKRGGPKRDPDALTIKKGVFAP